MEYIVLTLAIAAAALATNALLGAINMRLMNRRVTDLEAVTSGLLAQAVPPGTPAMSVRPRAATKMRVLTDAERELVIEALRDQGELMHSAASPPRGVVAKGTAMRELASALLGLAP